MPQGGTWRKVVGAVARRRCTNGIRIAVTPSERRRFVPSRALEFVTVGRTQEDIEPRPAKRLCRHALDRPRSQGAGAWHNRIGAPASGITAPKGKSDASGQRARTGNLTQYSRPGDRHDSTGWRSGKPRIPAIRTIRQEVLERLRRSQKKQQARSKGSCC